MAEKLGLLSNETPAHVVHYVAVFEPNTFTVCFNANGGERSMGNQTFGGADSPRNLTKNAFIKAGYEFVGWAEYSDEEKPSDGTGTIYRDGALFENVTTYRGEQINNGDTITLYAQWERLPDVTIFYTPKPTSLGAVELNLTESNELDPQDGMVSESLNPETGTARGATAVPGEGSVFVGWYDAQDTERSHPLTDGSTTYKPEKDLSGRYRDGSYVALFRLK